MCAILDANVAHEVRGAWRRRAAPRRWLHQDFKDRALVANPAGKVCSTIRSHAFGRAKRDLLRQTRCAAPYPEGGDR